jgi:Short repeat of unknown function (DUF308)
MRSTIVWRSGRFTGIGWLVAALLLFQWDYTTVYAISFLFGAIALTAAANEFVSIAVSITGWKIAHGVLDVLFVIAGIWALVHPHAAFTTLAALIAFFLLAKGIFDVTVAWSTSTAGGSSSRPHRRHRARLVGCRLVQGEDDPAGGLRRRDRSHPRRHRILPRLQAQGHPDPADGDRVA